MDENADALKDRGFGPVRPAAGDKAPPLRRRVLEYVRSRGAMSRVDVASHLGVSPASVTSAVNALLGLGLLVETSGGPRSGGRGRPPVALEVAPQAGLVAGLKISDPVSTAVLTDFTGRPLAHVRRPAQQGIRSTAEVLDETARLFEELVNKAGVSNSEVNGIGVGLPGRIDFTSGRVHWSPLMTDRSVDLRALVSERLGQPVAIDNDANLATLAELWFGEGRSLSDFVVITIEHGVGMGLVINHELYRGANRVGLELGHTIVKLGGARCRCGQLGCLEAYVADYALAVHAARAMDLPYPSADSDQAILEKLHQRARADDQTARSIFRDAGRYLAVGIANVISLYDPSKIILSGERLEFDDLYAEDVLSEIGKHRSTEGSSTRIQVNVLGDLVWARGAAALALDALTEALTLHE